MYLVSNRRFDLNRVTSGVFWGLYAQAPLFPERGGSDLSPLSLLRQRRGGIYISSLFRKCPLLGLWFFSSSGDGILAFPTLTLVVLRFSLIVYG
ncbi:hypothetical protein Acr_08g0009060 [Actinidia rufa]|uniref:Uncharacterized protein n=1 Tax=Actinidia rufa TaxID=165716 RepID=A0A7J0F1H6_9ERIC|nr:hypothetical protein Acr_08g0009060 [Actinidia rufa]